MNRKKKLRIFQLLLFLGGLVLIFITFLSKKNLNDKKIISTNLQKEIEKKLKDQEPLDLNKFYNVKYSGLDLEGNRYTITSQEAVNSELKPEIVNMNVVKATFYFNDDTELNVSSLKGMYNNKTLDIRFDENVEAKYFDGKLSAGKAEFSNSKGYLTVSENVKIIDKKGTIFADNLVFDLRTKKLNINSEKENLIKSSIKLK